MPKGRDIRSGRGPLHPLLIAVSPPVKNLTILYIKESHLRSIFDVEQRSFCSYVPCLFMQVILIWYLGQWFAAGNALNVDHPFFSSPFPSLLG